MEKKRIATDMYGLLLAYQKMKLRGTVIIAWESFLGQINSDKRRLKNMLYSWSRSKGEVGNMQYFKNQDVLLI